MTWFTADKIDVIQCQQRLRACPITHDPAKAQFCPLLRVLLKIGVPRAP
jgi:hypothetical protein